MASTLLLTRDDVAALLPLEDCITAVEAAFRSYGEGRTMAPAVLGLHTAGGGFHVKAAIMDLSRPYFAAKLNANFPENRERFALPTIQGVLALCDARSGTLLALMDSIEITILRAGAATAVAARHLALRDASVMTVCGCGNQGRVSVRAVSQVRPLESIYLWDIDFSRAARLAAEMGAETGVTVQAVEDLRAATIRSDIVVTCTPSTRAFLGPDDVRAGAFVAAVGADSPHKHEIVPALMAGAAVIADVTEQCAEIGDLHHAIEAGVMALSDVRADLGSVVAGRSAARRGDDEVVVFDSTGTALQDVAAAALAFERALALGRGARFEFA